MTSLSNTKRIVALVDMDCFYVQVVQRKDPSLKKKPCAVVQYNTWQGGGIIAVGYEARKFGVTRQMRGKQAKEKCPDIVLVSVPESRGKADLTQFREAGAEVIEILAEFTDCLERASVDEAYMDLTNTINKRINDYKLEDVAFQTFSETHLLGFDNMDVNLTDREEVLQCDLFNDWLSLLKSDEYHFRLAVGAVIANDMRSAVQAKTGFTCSAGVGPNKMLAKVVAGFHKPNQQTLVLPVSIEEMFKTTKIRKIRSLGGKVGAQLVEKFNVEFMSDLLKLSLNDLQTQIGIKSGELVYGLSRGVDHEPVRPRQLPKSVGCSKNFRGLQKLKTTCDVKRWLGNLCEEIIERLDKEKEQNHRFATLFTVGCLNDFNQSQSRRCNVFHATLHELKEETYKSLCEFNQSTNAAEWAPAITNLNLNASKFQSLPACGTKTISAYMSTQVESSTNNERSSSFDQSFSASKIPSTNIGISRFFSTVQNNFQFNSQAPTLSSSRKRCEVGHTLESVSVQCNESQKTPVLENRVVKSVSAHVARYHKINSRNDLHINPVKTYSKLSETPISSTILKPTGCDQLSRFCKAVPDENLKQEKGSELLERFHEDPLTDIMLKSKQQKLSNKKFHQSVNQELCSKSITIDVNGTVNKDENLDDVIKQSYSTSINDLMHCEKCGKRLLAWDLPDHMDFHYAKEVQDSMKYNFIHLYNNENSTNICDSRSSSKVRDSLKQGPPRKRRKVENLLGKYFSPVKK